MNALNEIVQRYSGQSGGTAPAPEDPHADFQQVARAAPAPIVANGISQAFRSDQTPPFPEMLAKLFGNSDATQRWGLLNRLLSSLGPETIRTLPGLGGLSGLLTAGRITPEQASQISPQQVEEIAAHAERRNPSVIDEISHFYAQHPQLMQAAGGLALTIAVQHMLRRQ